MPVRLLSSSYGRMAAIFVGFAVVFGLTGLAVRWATAADAVSPVAASAVDAGQQSLLVDAAWLAQRLESGKAPVIVDLSAQDVLYDGEHIPGAIHAWWQDAMDPFPESYGSALRLADNPYTLPAYWPDLGATPEDTIVVYDNAASEHAAWFVWVLRANGYPHAIVLDGGLAAWKGAGQPTSDAPAAPKAVATPDPGQDGAYTWDAPAAVATNQLRNTLEDPNLVIIDARTPQQARDTVNDTVPLGMIPGAKSLPAPSVMHPDGTFLTGDELTSALAPLQLAPDNEIVVYGRFGTDTGRVWLALRLAGYDNVRVYDEGWQTWATTPDLPTAPLP
jgi:thiosulfate/3-mercaptopyruvate sulfurtransferase